MKNSLFFITFLVLPILSISQITRKFNVVTRSDVGTTTLWDGSTIRIYGFSPLLSSQSTLPGKTLYVNEGDSVLVDVFNSSQGSEHTVHFHGLDLATDYDGDPLTSPYTIMHLKSRVYPFLAKHAGTYLYHCYVDGVVHVQMGMYGMVVVKALGGAKTAWTSGPSFNKSYNWLTSEIDKAWHTNIPLLPGGTGKVPKYKPGYFLVNGKSEQQILTDDSIKIAGAQGEYIYLRAANVGYYTNRIVFPAVLNATIIDSDGRPLSVSERNDTVIIMPGERYGVMLNATAQYTGTINIEYMDTNTDSVWNTQKIPVTINGIISVKENDDLNSQINIYPNPASNMLHVVFRNDQSKNLQYAIVNMLGQIVKQEKLNNIANTFSTTVHELENGIYFIKCTASNGMVTSKKFNIIH